MFARRSEVEEDGRASAAAAPCHPRCGEDGRRTGLRRCFPCWGRRLGRRRTHPHHGRTWPEARRRPPRASSIRPDVSCCCSAAGAPPPPRPPRPCGRRRRGGGARGRGGGGARCSGLDLRHKERISAAAVDLRHRDEREDEEVGFAVAYRMEVIL